MKLSRSLPRHPRPSQPKPASGKPGRAARRADDLNRPPEVPAWGHWFNVEGMQSNNFGAASLTSHRGSQ